VNGRESGVDAMEAPKEEEEEGEGGGLAFSLFLSWRGRTSLSGNLE